jgi:hypothetical protein
MQGGDRLLITRTQDFLYYICVRAMDTHCKERVPRDTARYLSVYRSIPRETRGKDEDQRLYLKRRVQELLRVQIIKVEGARVL